MLQSATSRIVLATRNRGKLREYVGMLSTLPVRLLTLEDFREVVDIEEVGTSFRENAVLKATGYAAQTNLTTLADDSGLEVSVLNGAPGILTSRYAGVGASDSERINKLIEAISATGQSDRSARFVCAIAIFDSRSKGLQTFEGSCEGQIALTPTGVNGFGYDPVFIPNGFQESFGSLPEIVKRKISHRARALDAARDYLRHLYDSHA